MLCIICQGIAIEEQHPALISLCDGKWARLSLKKATLSYPTGAECLCL